MNFSVWKALPALAIGATFLGAGGEPLRGADPSPPPNGSVMIQSLGLAAEVPERAPGLPVYVWGGETEMVALAVEAPLGARLNVRADVFQVGAGSLLAPLAKDLVVADSLDFSDRTRRTVTFAFTAPVVRRTAAIVLRFRAQTPPAGDPARWEPVGEVNGAVFEEPVALAGTLAAELAKRDLRLAVFGKSPALRAFFAQRKVEFEDLGPERPETFNSKLLYAAEVPLTRTPDAWPPREAVRAGAKLFLFTPKNSPLAGVFTTPIGSGFVVKVSLPILVNLPRSPLRQTELVELFRGTLVFSDQSAAAAAAD